jgi:high-affinity iron transporter
VSLPRPKSGFSISYRRILVGVVLLVFANSQALWAADEAKRLLALIDYMGGDYRNAVQGSKILNEDEYQEMTEFSARSLELFERLKESEGQDRAGIEKDLRTMTLHIKEKSGEDLVPQLAQQIKDRLIATYKIVTHPKTLPNLETAKAVYSQNCAQCHGETGRGDGPAGETMQPREPKPANFLDADLMSGLSAFKAFNTTSFGIQGTGMPNFSALSEETRWEASFYVLSLRFSPQQSAAGKKLYDTKKLPAALTDIAALAGLTDGELLAKLQSSFPHAADAEDVLAYLRRGLLEERKTDPLLTTRTYLREAVDLYQQGRRQEAYQKSVDAYLDGFELAEPALFAKDPAFGRGLESQLTEFRNAIRQGVPAEETQKRQLEITAKIDEARQMLTREDSFSAYYSFLNSALIILREGLEAALILAAIVAMLKVTGANQAVRYVHVGWVLALVAGGLTWLATETILTFSGRHRESMEGFISVFAAVALFYVGYWLHTRTEAKRWQAFIQDKVKNVLSGKKIFGLVGISFFAVYREAFEVVLFYQALWLQNESNRGAVIWGFLAGLSALLAVIFAILKLGLRIPLKYFFGATGTLLYIMAFIFAGKGINELQAAGWVSSTPVSFPLQAPFLGVYPTVETLAAQALMLLAFVTTSISMARENHKSLRDKESYV